MSITAHTQPDTYMAAYSAIPLRVESDNVDSLENLKYSINISWDKLVVTSAVAVTVNNLLNTKLTFSSPHNFKVGDSVFLDGDISNPQYTDYYVVVSVPNTTDVIVNFQLGAPLVGTTTLSKVVTYKMSPDLQGEAKLDISNTIKDFVSSNLEDNNDIYSAADTRFAYELFIGEESKYVLEFEDNTITTQVQPSVGNNVAFFNTSITSLVGIPFQVGDSIQIQQDEFEWVYIDNLNSSGLAFTGATQHNFKAGQIVTVTGQITEPYYNGPVTVADDVVTDSTVLRVSKSHTTSTPVEGGSIFGVPRPSYNTVAEITAIYIDGSLGLVVETNQTHKGPTQPIPGTIKFADDRLTTSYNELNITSLNAFNAHINRLDYSVDAFDPYVIKDSSANQNNFSTILQNDTIQHYRIEKSTKSWLLAHVYQPSYTDKARFYFFDSVGSIISISELANVSGEFLDYYVPVGIDQLLASPNLTTFAGSDLSAVTETVDSYSVALFDGSTLRSNYIRFDINDDCSRYELYHLMWKDRMGSWLSYPFKYISKDSTEFERKSYYKKEGAWDLDNNTFGYNSYGRGESSYFSRSRDKINLNSGWIEEHENLLIKDLLQSTEVYVQKPDGTLLGCIIDNNSLEFMKEQNVDIFQYNLNVRLSSNETRY